jgi:alkylation response protein AidB-like acyl-CoA dehydrogenase
MKFQLTEEQHRLREETREYAQNVIEPQAIELDRAAEHPTEILDELGDRGYAGLTLPEEYGGMGEGMVELSVVTEELSAVLMPVASALALHLGVAEVIQRFGTEEQRNSCSRANSQNMADELL